MKGILGRRIPGEMAPELSLSFTSLMNMIAPGPEANAKLADDAGKRPLGEQLDAPVQQRHGGAPASSEPDHARFCLPGRQPVPAQPGLQPRSAAQVQRLPWFEGQLRCDFPVTI